MHTQKFKMSLVFCMFLYLQTGKVIAWFFFPLNSFFSTRASTTSCLASKRFTPLKEPKWQKMITEYDSWRYIKPAFSIADDSSNSVLQGLVFCCLQPETADISRLIISLQHFISLHIMIVMFMHLQPLSTEGRHGPISSNHSEAWQWVSLWQQEVSVIMSRSHLHCTYKTQTQWTDEHVRQYESNSIHSTCRGMDEITGTA